MTMLKQDFFLFITCVVMWISGASGSITFFAQDILENFKEDFKGPYPNSDLEHEIFLSYLVDAEVEIFQDYEVRGDYESLTIDTFTKAGDVLLSTGDNDKFGIENIFGLDAGRYPVEGDKYIDAKAKEGGFFIKAENRIAAFGFYGIDLGDFKGDVFIQTSLRGENIKKYPLNLNIDSNVSILDGSVVFFGIIDKDEFDKIEFLTSGSQDIFAFDKFTVANIRQLEISCKNATFIVDDDCTTEIPVEEIFVKSNADSIELDRLFDSSNADSIELDPLPSLLGPGTYTYEIKATFLEGTSLEVSDTCTGTLEVLDTSPPEVICISFVDDANGTCLATVEKIGQATDNCGIDSTSQDPPVGSSLGLGDWSVDYSATDTSGNTGICTEIYRVIDTSVLEVFCLELDDVEADANCGAIIPDIGTASDNCNDVKSEDQVAPVGDRVGLGLQTITFTADDNQGNVATCSSSFTVSDSTPPEVTCMGDSVLDADEFCGASLPDIGSATDNCEFTEQQTPAPNTPVPLGAYSITYTAKDNSNNSASCSTRITVVDGTPPEVTCNSDNTVTLDANCEAVLPDIGRAVDNCGIDTEIQIPSAGETLKGVSDKSIGFSVWDNSGNSGFCSTTLNLIDETAPQVTCIDNIERTADSNCQAIIPDIGIDVTDNCDLDTNEVQNPVVGSRVGLGLKRVTLTSTDKSNNSASCSTNFRVVDESPPDVFCLDNFVVNANDQCGAVVPDIGDAVDNCDVVNEQQNPRAGTVVGVGVTTITYTAGDGAFNSASCTTKMEVVDNSRPTVSCSDNIQQLACEGTVPDIGSSNDNCGIASTKQSPSAGTNVGLGDTFITYTATDNYGNMASCSTVLSVTDTGGFGVSCIPNVRLQADANCQAMVPSIGDIRAGCGVFVSSQEQYPSAGTIISMGEIEKIDFTAIDQGTSAPSSCSTEIVMEDNTPPVQARQSSMCLWPANDNYYCESLSTLYQGTDNCGIQEISFVGCSSNPAYDDYCSPDCFYDETPGQVCFRARPNISYNVEARALDVYENESIFSRRVEVPAVPLNDGSCVSASVVLDSPCDKNEGKYEGKGKGKGKDKSTGKGKGKGHTGGTRRSSKGATASSKKGKGRGDSSKGTTQSVGKGRGDSSKGGTQSFGKGKGNSSKGGTQSKGTRSGDGKGKGGSGKHTRERDYNDRSRNGKRGKGGRGRNRKRGRGGKRMLRGDEWRSL